MCFVLSVHIYVILIFFFLIRNETVDLCLSSVCCYWNSKGKRMKVPLIFFFSSILFYGIRASVLCLQGDNTRSKHVLDINLFTENFKLLA